MGIHIIKMPDIGEGIAEVELAEWHVKQGDTVIEDQVLADVMTDKATVQVPSPVHGVVLSLGGKVGEVMAVGSELIRLEVEGAGNVRSMPNTESTSTKEMPSSQAVMANENVDERGKNKEDARVNESVAGLSIASVSSANQSSYHSAARPDGEKPLASPAVRRRAWELGIVLQYVPATGAAGQITHQDLDSYLAAVSSPQPTSSAQDRGRISAQVSGASFVGDDTIEDIPVIGLRRKIAQKMQESKRRIPHFTYVEELDVTELEQLRHQLNLDQRVHKEKLTLLPFIARAMTIALRDFPQMSARYDDEAGVVHRYRAVHLGIAVQTDAGLMVPVLRHADQLNLRQVSAEIARLAKAVREGHAAREELSGSTITLTSLGALGGIVSTPVINYPEVAIVGVNRVVERPVIKDGLVVARKIMNLSSSFDHRVVDGMHAAQFIQRIRVLLECPALLFTEDV